VTGAGSFRLAAAGDAIVTRSLSAQAGDRSAALFDRIRDADAGLVNLEVLLHDYEGYPAAESGGTYMRAPPRVADELLAVGFDVFAAANNHVGDYSHGGMTATMRELEARDVPYAGLGRTLAAARAPAYTDTPRGRLGVVAACTTFPAGTEAGRQRPDLPGRPGLSPLHLETGYVVPGSAYRSIRTLSERLGLEAVKDRAARQGFPVPGEDDDGFAFLDVDGDHLTFERGEEYRVERRVDEADARAVLQRLRGADRQSDWVVASLHVHEGAGGRTNDETVPEFLESFARDCVDAGADAVVGHGPHVLRGLELYDGAPLFYSLGNFAMQNETVSRLPAEIYDRYGLDGDGSVPADLFDERVFDEDGERTGFLSDRAFWETVVPVCEFGPDGVEGIDLYPAELGFEATRPRRGFPRVATGDAATRILDRFAALSAPYGTDVEVDGDVGSVAVGE
jgi:poly-gamma-glutamate capsule biosynthesis protein CapA/YwtB (metallophosphatase superfamily)